MIYDDENEDEEEVKGEGDKSGNSEMTDQSITVQQQENDSSNHPVWKMKLIGHSPTIKQYAICSMCVH